MPCLGVEFDEMMRLEEYDSKVLGGLGFLNSGVPLPALFFSLQMGWRREAGNGGVLGFRDVTVCGLPAQAHYGQHPDGSAQKLSLVAKKAFELRGSEFSTTINFVCRCRFLFQTKVSNGY